LDSLLLNCTPFLAGGGRVEITSNGARFLLPHASAARYGDAQLDDYAGLPRKRYPHRPPLTLSLRARFSDDESALQGTAGFGFWNNPFGAQSKIPALPRAIWFFYSSPPSNMPLAIDVSGFGWKAACIDAGRASALAWAPLAPFVMLACRLPGLYRAIWPRIQRALGISESPLTFREGAMTDWHTYQLEWRRDGARWWVDGESVLETDQPPRGRLGLVVWIDNQYAVVTPQGRIRFGLLDTSREQWLEIADVHLA